MGVGHSYLEEVVVGFEVAEGVFKERKEGTIRCLWRFHLCRF